MGRARGARARQPLSSTRYGEQPRGARAPRRGRRSPRDPAPSARVAASGARLWSRLVAHGSSDNAAAYGVYAFSLLAGLTAFRESISLLTYYEAAPDLRDSIVVAISQSGRTPDVVEYVEAARGKALLTVALTNEPDSPIAAAANVVVPLYAGREEAIAATKTYTTSLAALALLAGAHRRATSKGSPGYVVRCAEPHDGCDPAARSRRSPGPLRSSRRPGNLL